MGWAARLPKGPQNTRKPSAQGDPQAKQWAQAAAWSPLKADTSITPETPPRGAEATEPETTHKAYDPQQVT